MDYSFRIRFNRSSTDVLQIETERVSLPTISPSDSVVMFSSDKISKICDSDQFLVIGSGYSSAQAAEIAGREVKTALIIALASVRVGVDFGDRAAKGIFTNYGLKEIEEVIGKPALNNTHGLMVFESVPAPRFVSFNAKLSRVTTLEKFTSAYSKSLRASPTISQRHELSYTLFNGSFFQPTADSRFLLLVMAVEALIQPRRRPDESFNYIRSLIQQTKNATLTQIEKESILGTLKFLCNESISQAGRRTVSDKLGDRKYFEKTPADFFKFCYGIRSDLVHGNLPTPTLEEVSRTAAILEVFVSDLLTVSILGDSTN